MRDYYLKNLGFALVGVLFGMLVLFFVFPERFILSQLVTPPEGIDIGPWTSAFADSQGGVIVTAAFGALVWHCFALLTLGRAGDDRLFWVVLGVIAILIGVFYTLTQVPPAQSGVVWALLFAALNAAATYWLATVLWTPATHKYDPMGAASLRRRLGL